MLEERRSQISAAVNAIRAIAYQEWRVLIILGSGLGALADEIEDPIHIDYTRIPGFARSTVEGHGGEIVLGTLKGVSVAVMKGRFHFYEGHEMWQVTFPVRVARAMGADVMMVTNVCGGINREFQVGDVMLMTDHINLPGLSGHNPLMGPNDDTLGPRFPSLTEAYDSGLRQFALDSAQQAATPLRQGVYACVSGPAYETPAELRFLRAVGADAVGMSTIHEVWAARHGGMRVLGLAGNLKYCTSQRR
jgi:purine-nucleoside phosphorylase